MDFSEMFRMLSETGMKELEQGRINNWLSSKFPETNLIYTKRWIPNRNLNPCPMNVRSFIQIVPDLVNKNATLNSIWNEHIIYVLDNYQFNNCPDFWQFPVETKAIMKGDCDDSGSYRISKAKSNGLGHDLYCALGFYGDTGHFFIVKIDNAAKTFEDSITVLENTSNEFRPIQYKGSKYDIHYLFNEDRCWKVKKAAVIFGSATKKLKQEFGIAEAKL